MSQRYVTLRTIAKKAKVSTMTVSYALRNDPRVAQSTRDLVQATARELKYRPDPTLSKLMYYLSNRKKNTVPDVLGFINRHSKQYFIENAETTRRFAAAATGHALELGHKVEVFWADDPALGPGRLSSILTHRGIQGLIIGPSYNFRTLAMDWRQFTAVALGFTLTAPNLHRVAANRYNNMELALRMAARRGYSRVGIIDVDNFDKRTNHLAWARFLVHQQGLAPQERLTPLLMEKWDPAAFRRWRKAQSPDAVIAIGSCLHTELQREGYRMPGDFGYMTLTTWDRSGKVAGVQPNIELTAVNAVDMLVGQIRRNEMGIPTCPRLTYIDGEWIEGESY